MKVLVVQPLGSRLGGAEQILWLMLRGLGSSPIQPGVVFLQPGEFEAEVAALGLPTWIIPAGRLRQPGRGTRAVRALSALLRRERPDLIVSWMAKAHLYAAPAAALAGMTGRLVWWQHGLPGADWMDRMFALLPSRAIGCDSESGRASQERLWPHRRAFVVHPGVESPPPMGAGERLRWRRRLGIPDGRVVIGIVARFEPWKGHDRFLEAITELRARGHDAHGLVVGGNAYNLMPGYEEEVHALALRLGLGQSVTFTGQVAEAHRLIQVMDVLVNASLREPFGITILEAMAASVPVVAFDDCGPAEIIEPEISGLLAPPGGGDGLADQLEGLLRDPRRRRLLGAAGRRRYQERFTVDAMVGRFERELEALSGPPAGGGTRF